MQSSVAAVNPTPAATPAPREPTAAASDNNSTPEEEAPPSTTTAAAPTSVLDTVDLAQLQSQYNKAVQSLLNKHKRYPRRAKYREEEGTVLLTLVVNRYGEVLSHEIKESSGNALLDKEVLAMVRRAQSLPILPDELAEGKDTITLQIPIQFILR